MSFARFFASLAALAVLGRTPSPSNNTSSQLSFSLTSGGNDNYFLRDNVTSAQLLLTSADSTESFRRLVVAFPAGNTGALTYFLPLNVSSSNQSPLSVRIVNDSFTSTTREFNNAGVQADLEFQGNATLGVTIIGAIRAMRDYVESHGVMREIFNYTLAEHNQTSIRLHRAWINHTAGDPPDTFRGADLYLSVPPHSSAQLGVLPATSGSDAPPSITILSSLGSSNIVRVAVVTNETTIPGLQASSLFLPASISGTHGLQTALQGLANGSNPIGQEVSFLTYADKFTAGGWRFLTYFGRDTMISLRLLMPLLTPEAIESTLSAVIERANSTGALCHEETIGDYASFINMNNGQPELGNQPWYDYKMIDTDLLLLPTMSHYFLELPQGKGRAAQFLSRNATLQTGTYAEILNRTIEYNFARALPFAESPTANNLIGLRPGQPVGNWRDSNQGLGYGFYPFDVNTVLVPASLRATQDLLSAGLIDLGAVNASDIGQVADVWEQHASALFEVSVNASIAESRLQNFVQTANLSSSLLQNQTNNVSFFALSLMPDGTPVEVMNSDTTFSLVYGNNVSQTVLQHVIDVLQPYPRGLLTNVGMVVANPAYDSNRSNIELLDRSAYHGTVVWSFQQGMMAAGLERQLTLCTSDNNTEVDDNPVATSPSWCSDTSFVSELKDAQLRLWTSIHGARDSVNTEVWSYSFDNTTDSFSVADLGSLTADGTESDAIQLWSYGFLGIVDPTTNKTIDG